MKLLSIRGACLHMEMKDGETKDEAVGRLLDKLDEAEVDLSLWTEEAEEEEQDDEYDHCYECRGLGDDYIVNDDGELESWCDKCGVNPDRMKDDT